MSAETELIRRQIARKESQCDILHERIRQLEDKLDRLYEALQQVTNAITQHEESCTRTESKVSSYQFKNKALASYARSMVETLNGSSRQRTSQGLADTKAETQRQITEVQQQIEAARANLISCENSASELRQDLTQAVQKESELYG